MKVAYQAPFLDYSGYGEASRNHILAFDAAGIEVAGKLLTYAREQCDHGAGYPIIKKAMETEGDYDIKVMHATCDEYKRLHEPGKYNIGFCYWETTKLPDLFVEGLEYCDEIWTGSQSNKQAIEVSGVTKPVLVFPQPINTVVEPVEPYEIAGFDGYLFYSIFEWTERKNPRGLIQAYLEEFSNGENVGLLLKTYQRSFGPGNKEMIRGKVNMMRQRFGSLAPVFLYLDLMDRHQVMRIHQTGDCFVSAHHGEGWGVPQVEAALYDKPMISTGFGGCHEFFNTDSEAVLLPYHLAPVHGMEGSRFYLETQNWAEVDITDIRKSLRKAFAYQTELKKIGKRAHQAVERQFALPIVGKAMLKRLNDINLARKSN